MSDVIVRQLTKDDHAQADRINRIAFGTFFGLDTPSSFRGDGEVIAGRFAANPDGAFAAELEGKLVACGFVMDWENVGLLGPLTVDVDVWGRGIGHAMMDAMTRYMDRRGFALQGLFTHPQSPTHIRLYEAYGFRMSRITAVMEKPVKAPPAIPASVSLFSQSNEAGRAGVLAECREIAGAVYEGMDLTREIRSIYEHDFGDTILLRQGGALTGFACCHQGAGSEAGSPQTLVKFAAVLPGAGTRQAFRSLVAACESFAARRGTARLVAGTNTGRSACYEAMREMGFRSWMNGIAMLKPAGGTSPDGYNLPDVFAIDDWR